MFRAKFELKNRVWSWTITRDGDNKPYAYNDGFASMALAEMDVVRYWRKIPGYEVLQLLAIGETAKRFLPAAGSL